MVLFDLVFEDKRVLISSIWSLKLDIFSVQVFPR